MATEYASGRLPSARTVRTVVSAVLALLVLLLWVASGVGSAYAQQVVLGIGTGSLYALLALAIVLTFRSTGMINFAQGELAVGSTFIAWSLVQWLGDDPWQVWIALGLTCGIAFALGFALEATVLRRIAHGSILASSVVLLGVFSIIDSLLEWRYTSTPRPFPTPFADRIVSLGEVTVSVHMVGTVLVLGLLLLALVALFRTRLGLALRATSEDPTAARLAGVNASLMLGIGWGVSTVLGTVAGVLIAYTLNLSTAMMFHILLFALAAAVVGGLTSPLGAVIGGLLVGVAQNLVGVSEVLGGTQLRLPWAFLLILLVLLFRPRGLLGTPPARRL